MRHSAKILSGAAALLLSSVALVPQTATAGAVEEGKELAFDRKLGNCLACHKIAGGNLPGNIGPELVNMKARYPDKAKLRDQIWDATKVNPNTIMPPYGKHKIVSEEQLDKIVEFIYSL